MNISSHFVSFVLLSLVGTGASCEPIVGCAPAAGPSDPHARQIAVLNAITADIRAQGNTETAGSARVLDDMQRIEVSSVVSAKLKNSRILRSEFQQDDGGKHPRICVEVVVDQDNPAQH